MSVQISMTSRFCSSLDTLYHIVQGFGGPFKKAFRKGVFRLSSWTMQGIHTEYVWRGRSMPSTNFTEVNFIFPFSDYFYHHYGHSPQMIRLLEMWELELPLSAKSALGWPSILPWSWTVEPKIYFEKCYQENVFWCDFTIKHLNAWN